MGLASIIGGALGLGGAAGSHFSAKALQEDAQKFTTTFYKNRYQRQMEDMRAAGLNPILSYQTGVPGTAGGSAAPRSPMDIAASARAGAETAKAGEQERLLGAQADIATAQSVREKIQAQWDAENPDKVQLMRAAEVRGATGRAAIDQVKGAAVQRLQPLINKGLDYIAPDTSAKDQKFKYDWQQQRLNEQQKRQKSGRYK